jgi:hypothetical protein
MLNDVKPPPMDPPDPPPDPRGRPAPTQQSAKVDPEVRDSARESPVADVGIYNRPNTNRFSMANIGLSAGVGIAVLILVIVVFLLILW